MIESIPSRATILEGRQPLARGAVRDIWERPGHPHQILKTIREHKRLKYAGKGSVSSAMDHLRFGPYGTFFIEYRCYMRTAYRCALVGRPIPIVEIGGLILTDLGLAQVCEKISDPGGSLAPTLHDVIEENALTDERLNWLNDLIADLYAVNANVPDLKAKNIVLDQERERFVLVDGFGDKTLLPIRAWIAPLNRRQTEARLRVIADRARLSWDQVAKRLMPNGT